MKESLNSKITLGPSEEAFIFGHPVGSKEADIHCEGLLKEILFKDPGAMRLCERYKARKALEFLL